MKQNPVLDRSILHYFSYPVYQIKAISSEIILAAGGGGGSKTGVPNRIDVVKISRPATVPQGSDVSGSFFPSQASILGGIDTDAEAVMHLALSSNCSGAAVIFAIEGSTCKEYLLCDSEQDKLTDVNQSKLIEKIEQESEVSSSCIGNIISSQSDSSSSEEIKYKQSNAQTTKLLQSGKKSAMDDSNKTPSITTLQQTWNCHTLRKVNISPTSTIIQRKRLDSGNSSSNQYSPARLNDELSCIAIGGPGNSWCAIGTMHGSAIILDRFSTTESSYSKTQLNPFPESYSLKYGDSEEDTNSLLPLRPFFVIPDVGSNRCAVVSDVALSGTTFVSDSGEKFHMVPLLATISGWPVGSFLRLWCLPCSSIQMASEKKIKVDAKQKNKPIVNKLPYAEVKLDHPSKLPKKTETASRSKSDIVYRFRHCDFLHCIHKSYSDKNKSEYKTFLVTTEQPLSPNGKSVCYLSVWIVPLIPFDEDKNYTTPLSTSPLSLKCFAKINLPTGQLPACISVHPSRTRGLIALGSMEGGVDVFMISFEKHCLIRVYSMPTAHPIFVTSLTFLPARVRNSQQATEKYQSVPLTFELVSASADRVLRWHKGPSMSTVVSLSTRQQSILMKWHFWFFLVFAFLPILLGLFNTFGAWFDGSSTN